MVTELVHGGTSIPLLNPAMKIPTAPAEVRRAPPHLGEHTREILEELYDAERLAELVDAGVV
jgi:crotonobetainyl-CoA:carnitine CoA-transferase CaiB-like acyl-CoA transferase